MDNARSHGPTCPEVIAIDPDHCHAEHVGRTGDGRQFFASTPFVPAIDGAGNEFVALYLFDREGRLLEAVIDEPGPRATDNAARQRELLEQRVRELGPVVRCRIEIRPFSVRRFGIEFGLVSRRASGDDDSWWVELLPGNYMAFHEPFDSGEYDT